MHRSGAIGYSQSLSGRLAQRESASFTPKRSLVRSQYRPPGQGPCFIDEHGPCCCLGDYLSDCGAERESARIGRHVPENLVSRCLTVAAQVPLSGPEYAATVTMKARLSGHKSDLERLAEWLSDGPTRVAKDDDGYYLAADVIDDPPAGRTYYQVAQERLAIANGLGRVRDPSFRPVQLTGRYQDGDQGSIVVLAAAAEARCCVTAVAVVIGPDGAVKQDRPPRGVEYAVLVESRPEVAEAVKILATDPLGWVEMYKVFEIVRAEVNPTGLERSGLATKDEISAFTASANRPDVSGQAARHARMGGAPPKRIMSELEGRRFIADLVRAWMDTLESTS